VQRALALVAAVVVIGLGVVGTRHSAGPVEPAWAARLAPLAGAPLRPGARVGLVPPPTLGRDEATSLLFECSWQRPDVRWTLRSDAAVAGLDALLVLGAGPLPQGWRPAWRHGALALHVPGTP
jgi:hypothetical protein